MTSPYEFSTPTGPCLRLRPGGAADAARVAGMVARCSAESRYRRFFTGVGTLPAGLLHRLVEPARGVVVVLEPGGDAVALGHLVPLGDGCAELALLVEDRWQRQGVGTWLATRLLESAAVAGWSRVRATALPENRAVDRLVHRLGVPVQRRVADGAFVYELTVATVATAS